MIMNTRARLPALAVVALTAAVARPGFAQVRTEIPPVVASARPVSIDRIEVHGASLAGNLEGNAEDRAVIVYLPPSYQDEQERRYPVVYALHGYSVGAEQWSQEIHAPQTIEGAFGLGAQEMIVVVPDSKTMHNGSMYSSSVTTGDFERFIAHDLVEYVDAHYRTIPDRRSRGLVGHSMGGYGATRIGMKHSDVFGSLYIMSPCCLSPRRVTAPNPESESAIQAMMSPEESAQAAGGLRIQLASAAAWSPNPENPPLYLDVPWQDGELRPEILAKWAANAPLAFIDQYIGNLRQYNGIYIDVGDEDGLRVDSRRLSDVLDTYGVPHEFEEYPGTHTSGMGIRFQNRRLGRGFTDGGGRGALHAAPAVGSHRSLDGRRRRVE
jgi:enterochelin esterase-like enzyme